MKKIITNLIAIALLPSIGNSQISLVQGDLPTVFSSWVQNEDTTTHGAVPSGGANQTWDFSNFTVSETKVTNLQPLTATDASWSANFTTAQMVHYEPTDSIATYYSTNSTGFYLDGAYNNEYDAPVNAIVYQEKRLLLPVPFTYLNTRSNLAVMSMEVPYPGMSVKSNSYSQLEFLCDGYGSITTPAGTFPNTLRIKITSYNFDSLFIDYGGGYQLNDFSEPNDTVVEYIWVQNGTNSIVFYLDEDMNGPIPTGIIESATYYSVTPAGAPNPPTNLVVTPTLRTTYDKMQLNWSDNSNNESGFNIERSLDSTNWSVIANVATDVVSYLDQGLSPMTTYFYRVSAYNGIGTSAYSNAVSGNTDGPSSVSDQNLVAQIQVFPNPTNGIVSIQLTNNSSTTIELYNVIGERLISEQINQSKHTIDISNYPNGVYFLKADGNITKIIKQ